MDHHLDMGIPQPMPEDPFKDDVRPQDPNTPPPGRETYYKPYWKKGANTAAAPTPARTIEPARLDPYAVAPPVHIKARPVTSAPRVAKAETKTWETATATATPEVAPVSLTISDDAPPAPPMLLPATTQLHRLDVAIPSNPLRR
jgi:hypothetical protein